MDGTEVIEPLEERLIGRYARKAIKHPETKAVLVPENGLITEDLAVEIVHQISKKYGYVQLSHAILVTEFVRSATDVILQQVKKSKLERQLVLLLHNPLGNRVHS